MIVSMTGFGEAFSAAIKFSRRTTTVGVQPGGRDSTAARQRPHSGSGLPSKTVSRMCTR